MMLGDRYFVGGMLKTPQDTLLRSKMRAAIPPDWTCPPAVNNWHRLPFVRNQGRKPTCAAQAMSGVISEWVWETTHVATPVDADRIYRRAKMLDGAPNEDGTTFTAVLQAAIDEQLVPKGTLGFAFDTFDQYMFMLHEYDLAMLAFDTSDAWLPENVKRGVIQDNPNLPRRGLHGVVGCMGRKAKRDSAILNSWGPDWAAQGFALVPQQMFELFMVGGMAVRIPR